MKQLMITVLCFCAVSSFAQNGFFLQPEIGAGTTNSHAIPPDNGGMYYHQYPLESYATYNGELGFGYRFNNWSISSGAYFLRTGYMSHYSSGDLITIDTKEAMYDYQVLVPVVAAYRFNIGKRFFFAPGAGIAISYNAFIEETINQGGISYKQNINGKEFTDQYTRTSFWGITKATFGYKLNDRLNIIAGPEAQWMLSSMLKYTTADNYQRNYAYTFDAGITWNFKTHKPAAKEKAE